MHLFPNNVLQGVGRKRVVALSHVSGCRILEFIGADVRFFDPEGLPIKDDVSEGHEKVRCFFSSHSMLMTA